MLLFITSRDSQNTEFISEDGTVWYTVETPMKLVNRTTDVIRHYPKTKTVGQIMWKQIASTIVKIGDTELSRKEFLRSKGTFTGCVLNQKMNFVGALRLADVSQIETNI